MREKPHKINLLILAFDCHPSLPSLPIIAYKMCRSLAREANVTVVTRKQDDRIDVEGAIATYEVDIDSVKRPFDAVANLIRGGKTLGWTTKTAFTYPSYIAFERKVMQKFKKELQSGAFDVVARISPMSPVLPSVMSISCPIPFVIGPINGGLEYPVASKSLVVKEREWLNPVRGLSHKFPYVRSSLESAKVVLAGFQHTYDDLPMRNKSTIINFPEIGFDPEIFYPGSDEIPARKTILFAGRLVPAKRPDLAIRAMSQSEIIRQHRMIFVGDGPEMPLLESLIKKHSLEQQVDLLGATDQKGVAEAMRNSQIFAFPTMRELGAGVVIEAMACGLPCIVADHGAPKDLVNDSRGFRLANADTDSMTMSMQSALEKLLQDDALLESMRTAAKSYAGDFAWHKKSEHLIDIFEWAAGHRKERPDPYPLNAI